MRDRMLPCFLVGKSTTSINELGDSVFVLADQSYSHKEIADIVTDYFKTRDSINPFDYTRWSNVIPLGSGFTDKPYDSTDLCRKCGVKMPTSALKVVNGQVSSERRDPMILVKHTEAYNMNFESEQERGK